MKHKHKYIKTIRRTSLCIAVICFILFQTRISFGQDSGVRLETGGVQIVLPQGWGVLNQPTNIFTQQRARNSETGVAMSAGAFKISLSLEQYVAIGVAAFGESPEEQFERISKLTGISTNEIAMTVQSQIGRQMLMQLELSYKKIHFELLDVKQIQISGMTVYEAQSKQTIQQSGQVIYSRQFTLSGTSQNEIVNIAFAGASADIFQDNSLVDAIRK